MNGVRVAVLRPEPGNAATVARLRTAGLVPLSRPLFHVEPTAWVVPDPEGYDRLLLSSANAVRHAGAGLASLRALPVVAVGTATAAAARAAGLDVVQVGSGGVADLNLSGRVLHLCGRDHAAAPGAQAVPLYHSVATAVDANDVAGGVALLHSPRAAMRLAGLLPDRRTTSIVAISTAAASAAGPGWARVTIADRPDDAAMIAAAIDAVRAHADSRAR